MSIVHLKHDFIRQAPDADENRMWTEKNGFGGFDVGKKKSEPKFLNFSEEKMIKWFKFLSKTEFKMKNLNRGTGNKKMRENRRVNIFLIIKTG